MARCDDFDRAFEAVRRSIPEGPFDFSSNAKDGFLAVASARVSALFDPSNMTVRRLPPGRARSYVSPQLIEAARSRRADDSEAFFEPEGYSIKVETQEDYVDFIQILLTENPAATVCVKQTRMDDPRPLFALTDPEGTTPLLTGKAATFVQEIVVFLALAAGRRGDEDLVRVLARDSIRNLLQWRRYDAALFAAALEADRVTSSPRDPSAALGGKRVFGEVLEAVGRFREASKIYLEVVDEKRALGGETSRTACNDCCNAGLALKRIGAWDEAERAYSRAIAVGAEYRTRTGRDPTDGFPAAILDNLEKLLWARGETLLSALLRAVGCAAGLSFNQPHPIGDDICSRLLAKLPRGAELETARDALIRDFGERQMPLREVLLKLASEVFHSTLNSREVIEQQQQSHDNNTTQKAKRQQGAKFARDYARSTVRTARACSNCSRRAGPEPSDLKKPLSACARCGAVVYCSKACQTEHWKTDHRRRCFPTAQSLKEEPLTATTTTT